MKPYKDQFLEWERRTLLEALKEADGNQCRAARSLGIHRNTFARRLMNQGITDAEINATKIIRKKKWRVGDFLASAQGGAR